MRRPALLSAALIACLASCRPAGSDQAAARCVLRVGFRPAALTDVTDGPGLAAADLERAEVLGSWDGWQGARRDWHEARVDAGVAWRLLWIDLPPGLHRYAIRAGAKLVPDELNPRTAFIAPPFAVDDPLDAGDPVAASVPRQFALEVSEIDVPDCATPMLAIDHVKRRPPLPDDAARGGALIFEATFHAGTASDDLDPATLRADLRLGGEGAPGAIAGWPAAITVAADADRGRRRLTATAEGLAPGKYTITIAAADRAGRPAMPVKASAFVEPPAADPARAASLATPPRGLADGLIYQIMVDRFRGDGGPLGPPRWLGDRAGGTLGGVRATVEAGYFDRLGVTTLWLSPVYQNPPGWFRGRDGRYYQSYHGYWPADPRRVEPLFGGEAALNALVASAHARGLRVILDAVPNHVHDSHPYYLQHGRVSPAVWGAPDPDGESWFNDGPRACVCGSADCGWGELCWFDSYLPDLNLRHPQARAQQAEDLAWWAARFDLDGLRIDAVPLMPRAATRRIVSAVRRQSLREGLDGLLLGEVYTGPGSYGRREILAYLGLAYDGLDSNFDFPLAWATRRALATADPGFGLDALEKEVIESRQAWYAPGAVMGTMIDNHDMPRFISLAAGDGLGDPWIASPRQPTDEEPYRRQRLGLAFMLTLPGLPVLYYGDEIGLAGGGDPDCRRVMPDVLGAALPPLQKQLLDDTARLGRLRRCSDALRRGEREVLAVDADHHVTLYRPPIQESAGTGAVLVVLSRDRSDATLHLDGVPAGRWREVLSGRVLETAGGTTSLTAERLAPAIYLEESSPCHERQ